VHLLLALVLAFCALMFIGQEHQSTTQVEIAGISSIKDTILPAQRAGLKAGEVLVSIDGVAIHSAGGAAKLIRHADGHALAIVVRDGQRLLTVHATPVVIASAASYPILGINLGPRVYLTHPGMLGSVASSGTLTWQVLSETAHDFATAFSPGGVGSLAKQVTNPSYAKQVQTQGNQPVSMIGALRLLADALKSGAYPFLGILISLNISLGILNMLPMLPLDGGHVAIALYEGIRSRARKARYHADVRKLMPVVYVFLAFLILFVAFKMYLDIAHGTSNPFG
jgi:membrane-associated protease RseP (regulator of RpoE activity)